MTNPLTDEVIDNMVAAFQVKVNSVLESNDEQKSAMHEGMRAAAKVIESALAGDRRDAERYRHIRDQASKLPQDFETICDAAFTSTHGDSHNFDMNIDDQIAAIKGKSHE